MALIYTKEISKALLSYKHGGGVPQYEET